MSTPFDPIDHVNQPVPSDLDRYLDGLMSPAERRAFDARLASDPTLRAELDLQRGIDAALVRAYPYDPPAPAPIRVAFAWRRVGLIGAIAAAVVLAVSLYLALSRPDAFKHRPAETVYAAYVEKGWKPSWVCENDEQSAAMVSTFLRLPDRAVIVPLNAAGIEVVGWIPTDDVRLGTPLSPQTLSLLTRVDGKPVLVLVDLAERDRGVSVAPSSGLRVFRREIEGVVLYEVTPLPTERVLPAAVRVTPPVKPPRGS